MIGCYNYDSVQLQEIYLSMCFSVVTVCSRLVLYIIYKWHVEVINNDRYCVSQLSNVKNDNCFWIGLFYIELSPSSLKRFYRCWININIFLCSCYDKAYSKIFCVSCVIPKIMTWGVLFLQGSLFDVKLKFWLTWCLQKPGFNCHEQINFWCQKLPFDVKNSHLMSKTDK